MSPFYRFFKFQRRLQCILLTQLSLRFSDQLTLTVLNSRGGNWGLTQKFAILQMPRTLFQGRLLSLIRWRLFWKSNKFCHKFVTAAKLVVKFDSVFVGDTLLNLIQKGFSFWPEVYCSRNLISVHIYTRKINMIGSWPRCLYLALKFEFKNDQNLLKLFQHLFKVDLWFLKKEEMV